MATLSGVRNNNEQSKSVRMNEEVQLFDLKDFSGEYQNIRLIGPLVPYKQIWVKFTTKAGKDITFPKIIGGMDPVTGEIIEEQPYYKYAMRDDNDCRIQTKYLVNAIIRQEEEDGDFPGRSPTEDELTPRKFAEEWDQGDQEFFFKDIENRGSRTPVRVFSLPMSVVNSLSNLEQLNKLTNKKTGKSKCFSVDHPKYGADLNFLYDANKTASEKYSVSIDEKGVALQEKDYRYLIWDITNLKSLKQDSVEEQEREVARWLSNQGLGGSPDEDEGGRPPRRSKQEKQAAEADVWGEEEKPAASKSKRPAEESVEDVDDDMGW